MSGTLRAQLAGRVAEMRQVADTHPETGACAVATALELWSWTANHVERARGANRGYEADAYSVPLVEALGWLLASRALVMEAANEEDPALIDTCHAHVAHACGEAGRVCAQLVFGSLRHPAWATDLACCYTAQDLEAFEEFVPGLTSMARACTDVIEADGSHPLKAGPCVRLDSVEEFVRLRTKLDGCLAGAHIAKIRAAAALR